MIQEIASRSHMLTGFFGVSYAGAMLPENGATLVLQIILVSVTIAAEIFRRSKKQA